MIKDEDYSTNLQIQVNLLNSQLSYVLQELKRNVPKETYDNVLKRLNELVIVKENNNE